MLEAVAVDRVAEDQDGPVREERERVVVLCVEQSKPVGRRVARLGERDPARRFRLRLVVMLQQWRVSTAFWAPTCQRHSQGSRARQTGRRDRSRAAARGSRAGCRVIRRSARGRVEVGARRARGGSRVCSSPEKEDDGEAGEGAEQDRRAASALIGHREPGRARMGGASEQRLVGLARARVVRVVLFLVVQLHRLVLAYVQTERGRSGGVATADARAASRAQASWPAARPAWAGSPVQSRRRAATAPAGDAEHVLRHA